MDLDVVVWFFRTCPPMFEVAMVFVPVSRPIVICYVVAFQSPSRPDNSPSSGFRPFSALAIFDFSLALATGPWFSSRLPQRPVLVFGSCFILSHDPCTHAKI